MRNLFILAFVAAAVCMTACKQDKGVTTEHGHRFINHTNKGGTVAQLGEKVKVRMYTYLGDSLLNSTQKDSKKPFELTLPSKEQIAQAPGGKVPAFIDALLLMSEGDSATVFMKLDSTMKQGLPENLKKYDEARFEVMLVDIISAEELAAAQKEAEARVAGVKTAVDATAKDYADGKLKDKLTVLPSGLKVLVVEKGSGEPVKAGENIETMYYGCLKDGTHFDDSFSRGAPLAFPVGAGRMIPGYDEGVQQINHGGKAYFFLPYQLGYGEAGNPPAIPAKAELIFYVEVL